MAGVGNKKMNEKNYMLIGLFDGTNWIFLEDFAIVCTNNSSSSHQIIFLAYCSFHSFFIAGASQLSRAKSQLMTSEILEYVIVIED